MPKRGGVPQAEEGVVNAIETMAVEHGTVRDGRSAHSPRVEGELYPYGSKASMGCPLCIAEETAQELDRKTVMHVYDHDGNVVQSIPVDGFELVTRDLPDDCELAYVLDRPAGFVAEMQMTDAGRRAIAKMYEVPDALVGIPTPWWRRVLHRFTRQP